VEVFRVRWSVFGQLEGAWILLISIKLMTPSLRMFLVDLASSLMRSTAFQIYLLLPLSDPHIYPPTIAYLFIFVFDDK
jgi:hypothetical protein